MHSFPCLSLIKQTCIMRALLRATCLQPRFTSSDLCLVSSFWICWVTLMLSVAFADLSSCEPGQEASLLQVLNSPWGVSSSSAPTGNISCQAIAYVLIKLGSNRKRFHMQCLKVSFSVKNFIHVYKEISWLSFLPIPHISPQNSPLPSICASLWCCFCLSPLSPVTFELCILINNVLLAKENTESVVHWFFGNSHITSASHPSILLSQVWSYRSCRGCRDCLHVVLSSG